MPKSVRRTVHLVLPSSPWQVPCYREKSDSNSALRADVIQRFVGEHLPNEYTVRYTLNPKGYLLVQDEEYAGGAEHYTSVTKNEGLYTRLPVCFLPASWIGKRVSRKAWVKGGR